MANHGRSDADLGSKRYTVTWNWRTTLNEVHRPQIREFITEHSDLVPGSEAYLADYQRQFTRYLKANVSKAEIEAARVLAQKWNEEKPPPEVQAR
ncbi:hypothetical protein BDN72DRAFT_850869 [Pluteus cervinus]|uniref:Uncharacterized protein n=1 Tax=Pluteus cervinus TaxID=181527 RepID=A0ACD3A3V9_9AGAR|nr:hypothetical protein BDN72DRAFT_850869 [Pluteus cervinus]